MEEIYCGSLACVSLADGVTMMKEDCYEGEAVSKRVRSLMAAQSAHTSMPVPEIY